MFPMKQKEVTSVNGKCQAKTKAGEPCRAPAVLNEPYCSFHLDPNLAAKLGRKGGQKNRSQNPPEVLDEPLKVPQNTAEACQILLEAIASTRAGRMSPSQATCLATLVNTLIKAQPAGVFEKRLSRIEKHIRERSENVPVDSAPHLLPLDDPDPAEKEETVELSKPS